MRTGPTNPAPEDCRMSLLDAREKGWYHDPSDSRCPHDAWLSRLDVDVDGYAGNEAECRKNIQLVLLGAYQNGFITYAYRNVRLYDILLKREAVSGKIWRREDWLEDDVAMIEKNILRHRIPREHNGWTLRAP